MSRSFRNTRQEACCIVCRCAVFVAVFCNDIPLESKEVPIKSKLGGKARKRMASCHTWTCKKMKNAIQPSFSSVLLHIWCCYKTYTIKGLLLCPWCVVTVVANLHQTETGHHATNHFFLSWETTKQRGKNLDKLRFYWANMRKKAVVATALNNSEKGKQSFFSYSGFLRSLFGAFIRL